MSSHQFEDDLASEGSWDSTEAGNEEEPAKLDERTEIQDLARKETASVRRWRLIVVSLLAITGGVLSTFTYRILRQEDKDDYVDAVSIVSLVSY